MMHPPPQSFCVNPERLAFTQMEDVLRGNWRERGQSATLGGARYRFGVWGDAFSLYALDAKGATIEPIVLKAKLTGRKFLGTMADGRPTEGEISKDNQTVAIAVRKSASDPSLEIRYLECFEP